jgi:tellurite resistance protein TerC
VSTAVGWLAFGVVISALLALDLGVFHRRPHEVRAREAATWWAVWLGLAVAFNVAVLLTRGVPKGLEFTTGYLIELSLSVDNVFVFVLLFHYFRVPARFQHRVLFWGIVGALIMRGLMIAAGVLLIARAHWVLYLFGAFLLYSAYRMARPGEIEIHPEANPVLRLARRLVPMTRGYAGRRFFVRLPRRGGGLGGWAATPLFLVLLVVETTDVMFAVDSIPAIFGVTRDPFIVYTSNIFALLGLRSLYFVVAAVIRRFRYLRPALAAILGFVGLKMLLSDVVPVPIGVSLGVVATVLAVGALASLLRPADRAASAPSAGPERDP